MFEPAIVYFCLRNDSYDSLIIKIVAHKFSVQLFSLHCITDLGWKEQQIGSCHY